MTKLLLLIALLPFSLYSSLALPANDLSFSTTCEQGEETAIISFVGDILIHKPLYLSVLNRDQHFSSLWERTIPLLLKADYSVGNVEGPVAMGIDAKGFDHGDIGFRYDDNVYSGTNLVFNYHPRLLSDLQDSGVDMITAANNHATDRKSVGIDRTIEAAKAIGMKITGVRKSTNPDGSFYTTALIRNIRTAFIGCTEVLNGEDVKHQVLNCEGVEIFQIIKKLAADTAIDAIIILPHWGVEYSLEVKDYQRDYARRYIEAGAVAVVGSHPHVLQPWEKIVTRDKREGMVFYSLGNFVACQDGISKQTGAIFYLGLSKKNGQKAKVFAGAYSPVYRQDLSILPLEESSPRSYQENLETFYGLKMRIRLEDRLLLKMCQKKN